ncbi:hypothetical protein D3C81_129100 [compost metagenome]
MNNACFKTKNLGRDEIFISPFKQLVTTFGNYGLTELALNGPFRNIEHGHSSPFVGKTLRYGYALTC